VILTDFLCRNDDQQCFDAQDDEDFLSIKAGDRIQVLHKRQDGWLYGVDPNEEKGYFPVEFCQVESKRSKKTAHHRRAEESHDHDLPFADAEGMWVPRGEFQGEKSFGMFSCDDCSNTWRSAHAYQAFKQGCKRCDFETAPCCLWQNSSSSREPGGLLFSIELTKANYPFDS
jgi:hypothetical protein